MSTKIEKQVIKFFDDNKSKKMSEFDIIQLIVKFNKEITNKTLEEVAEKYDEKIKNLQEEKQRYKEDDDQYSWHIVDDEQTVWKKAKEILLSLRDKY